MRIAKYIANAGYCSRRDAEKLIYSKKVYINNEIRETPSIKVLKNDIIKINDKQIIIEKKNKTLEIIQTNENYMYKQRSSKKENNF